MPVRAGRQANFRALNYHPDNFFSTVECQKCEALKFSKETEGFCCSKSNVMLDAFPQPQPYLYESIDSDGKHFLSNIRKYNCAFQMTSFGCHEINMTGFNPSFRIQGQVYHLIGSMVPTAGESPKFAQIYFIDNRESEVAARCAIIDGLRPDIVSSINELLFDDNHYVEVFKLAKEIFDNVNNRDIVLHYRDGGLRHISELHRSYDPLQYPLLFPHGTDCWHVNLNLQNGKKLTALVYYRYHIMVRQNVSVMHIVRSKLNV